MQTVLCENHFFESRLFGLSELHLALLGSSRPLPGQSWGPDGTQKTPKSDPKIGPKRAPKRELVLDCSWTHFGVRFGPQKGSLRGAHFSSFSLFSGSFFGTPFAPKTLFFAMKNKGFGLHFGPQNGPLWRPFFSSFFVIPKPSSDRKMQTVLYFLHFLLPRSGPQKTVFFKVFWTSILAPCWFRLGPILAPSWPLLASLCAKWPHKETQRNKIQKKKNQKRN